MKKINFILILIFCYSLFATYKTEILLEDEGVIWGFDFLNSEELYYSIREGKLYYYNLKTKKKIQIPSPKFVAQGQGGLLDVKINRENNKDFLYLTYSTVKDNKLTTALAKGEISKDRSISLKNIFTAQTEGDSSIHFGSRIAIQADQLFMTIGERGERKYAQSLKHHNGKILRLNLDGSPYKANPFAKEGLAEIYTLGHRNPQGIAIAPNGIDLYSCEFGPKGGDEVNWIKVKNNYGWPVITYGREYWGPKIGTTHKEGYQQPLVYWSPSISPSGMNFYSGNKIAEWHNDLFLAALGSRHLRRLRVKDHKIMFQEKLYEELNERIRQVNTGKDGYLYFSTDSGKIYKISEKKIIKFKK